MTTCNACGGDKPKDTYQACPTCRAAWRAQKQKKPTRLRKTVHVGEVLRLVSAIREVRDTNTPEFMEYLLDEANEALESIGHPERLAFRDCSKTHFIVRGSK